MNLSIENIEFGNKVFNTFCNDENLFVKTFRQSKAYRFCVMQVFGELVRLGVYSPLREIKKNPFGRMWLQKRKNYFHQ